uniref:C-type lectin domain-containing protein n=1 Tax=Amphiprion ocellaris TaxID=80972 RepID=A0A3Q1BBB4_AMPOC
MDDAVFVLFLLTVKVQGDAIQPMRNAEVPSSSPSVYYFIRKSKGWYGAREYCISEYTTLAHIKHQDNITALMNAPKRPYTGKAWIGLYGFTMVSSQQWLFINEQKATYFNWSSGEPDNYGGKELCVSMTSNGDWQDQNCSAKKASLCYNGSDYIIDETNMTWSDSKTNCERRNSTLAKILDRKTNSKIQKLLPQGSEVWLGLKKPILWYWTTTNEIPTFINWQPGQPDMQTDAIKCVAMDLKDGTWTDEFCNLMYPFFCHGIYKAQKTVVKMKLQSTANLEDPVISDNLQKQLHAALAKQSVSDFQLTWKKVPVKQKEEMASEDNC